LSTAHTIFYYDHFGSGVFRNLSAQSHGQLLGTAPAKHTTRSDLARLAVAEENEAEIWHDLTHVHRHVSRQAYDRLAERLPRMRYLRRA